MRMSDLTRRVAIAAGLAALAVAVAVPAVAADSRPLARYVPRDDLVVYSEFGGLDAHAAAWRQTAAYKMLNETTAGAMLSTVLSQVIDGALAALPEGDRPTGSTRSSSPSPTWRTSPPCPPRSGWRA